MIETFIRSRVTDLHGLFLALPEIRIRSYDYIIGGVDVVLCLAFWRHGFFMLLETHRYKGL